MFTDEIFNHINLLSTSQVVIYLADYKCLIPYLSEFEKYLSNEEKLVANRYKFDYLTNKSIISRGLLRKILARYLQKLPSEIELEYGAFGKPFLSSHSIHFNVSHSHNLFAYGISMNNNIGIDVELQDENIIDDIGEQLFTQQEEQVFSLLSSEKKRSFFFDSWVKKEALIKAYGVGMSYPIYTIDTLDGASRNKFLLTDIVSKKSMDWYCYPLKLSESMYSGAVATNSKISEIIYFTMDNQVGVFSKKRAFI